jgi:hypothetical protein
LEAAMRALDDVHCFKICQVDTGESSRLAELGRNF